MKRALVKMTAKQVNDIEAASEYGLYKSHQNDNYIYLVDENGKDRSFKGIFGNANEDVNAPYLVCTEHTKEDWEAYLEEHPDFSVTTQNKTERED